MKYLRNQIKMQDISSYAHHRLGSIQQFAASLNFYNTLLGPAFVSILYPEAHGHPSALLLQGDLVWSSGTSSLERARSVFREFLSLVCSSSLYPSSSFAVPLPSPEEPSPVWCTTHFTCACEPCRDLLLPLAHPLPSNSLNYDS